MPVCLSATMNISESVLSVMVDFWKEKFPALTHFACKINSVPLFCKIGDNSKKWLFQKWSNSGCDHASKIHFPDS